LDSADDILRDSQRVDLALWPEIMACFRQQLQTARITTRDIRVKDLIHSNPLFNVAWFGPDHRADDVLDLMAAALRERAAEHPDLANSFFDTILGWPCLSESAREGLRVRLS
jgi:hypothetical protein